MDQKINRQLAPKSAESAEESAEEVVSSTGCTGLIPTPPEDEPEAEAYTELYHIPRPTAEKSKQSEQ